MMILATVRFNLGPQIYTAHLSDLGWNAVHAPQILNTILNHIASPSDYGTVGDPIARAAAKVAETFKGEVIHVRPLPDPPAGSVY